MSGTIVSPFRGDRWQQLGNQAKIQAEIKAELQEKFYFRPT
jgi:hypothetical protein